MIKAMLMIAAWTAMRQEAPHDQHQAATAPAAQTQSHDEAAARHAALQARLDALDERLREIKTLRSNFEQRKFTALLKEPLISSGQLMLKGDSVRWDTRKPRPSTMTIADGEIKVFYPEAHNIEIYEAQGDLRELWGSPLPHMAVLRRHFVIDEVNPADLGVQAADGQQLLALELTPRSDDLKEHITSIRALIDAAAPCIRKMIITDADGDRTELEFRNIQLNADINDADLELRVPDGTRVSRPNAGREPKSATTSPDGEPGP